VSVSFRIHFHDVPHSDKVRDECEDLATALREEFPETSKCEVAISHAGEEKELHLHVTGKDLDLAAHAQARELHEAMTEAFDRVRRQLRKHHDKQIFSRRRSKKPRGE
jgi:ribosome-associated translation inhibitor RaiA